MVKVAVLGLAAVFLSLIAGSVKREYAVAVMIGTVLLLGIYSLSSIRMVIERIHEFEQAIGLSREYLGILRMTYRWEFFLSSHCSYLPPR